MDESVLRKLIAALETIYNVNVTNEARQQAQEYCERLKGDPSGPLYGYFLAHKDNRQPDVVRHFGLGLIENAVRYRWADGTLTPALKLQIRQNVMSLAAEGSQPLLIEQTFIKEKIARLFVEVAKREWLVEWTDMDPFLRQLFFKDETSREMSLLILKSLCEDVCIYDDAVAGLRKKDLREGLIVIMASEEVLKKQYPEGVKGHHDQVTLMVGETGNDGWTSRISVLLQEMLPRCQTESRQPADEKITLAALKLLSCTIDWTITTSIAAAHVVPVICQAVLSSSDKIRLAGAECYDVLSSRNLTDADREEVIWPLMDGEGVDLISKAYQTYATQIVQGDAYIFMQKMVQATVNLGEQQMCGKRNAYIPKQILKFLELLYSMASHPSVLISSIVSFFWVTLLRHDTFSKDPIVQSFVPPLLELYSGHLEKSYNNRRKVDPVYDHFATLDFDSASEFRVAATRTFQKAVDVIHLGVPIVPLDAFMWVANKVSAALKIDFSQDMKGITSCSANMCLDTEGADKLTARYPVKETAQFMSFDGTLTLMEVAVSSLTKTITDRSHPQCTQILEAMNTLLLMLIEYNGKNPAAMDRVVSSLSAFTDMFKINSALLFKCLDKLFQAVEYPFLPGMEDEVRDLRQRSASTLVKIARAIPDTLLPIYAQIEGAVQNMIKQDKILLGEKKFLLTFLLVVGFNSEGNNEGCTLIFERIVLPVAASFSSLELQQALSDPKQFMAFIGANDISEAATKSFSSADIQQLRQTSKQRRSQMSWPVDALVTFMKETVVDTKDVTRVDLWSQCLRSILPNLLSTIRCLNAICDSTLWDGLAPETAGILTMSAEEKEMMVAGQSKPVSVSDVSVEAITTGGATVALLVHDVKTWLSVLRDHSYKFLARISSLGPVFYSIPSLQTVLEQSLFQHVDYLTNRQLRFQINSAVQPIVLNCPPEAMESVLGHLLQVLFPYLDKRLSADWKKANDDGLVITNEKEDTEDLDVSDEIVREMMLRDLTKNVADFMFSTLDFNRKKPEAGGSSAKATSGGSHAPAHKEITPLALFILSNEVIAQSVLPLICHIMTFKDTRACTRSTETALCVLATLVQNYPATRELLGVFSTMVLRAAMEALHDPYHQEGQDKLILVITEVYVEVRAFDEGPKLVFQQAVGADMARLEAFESQLSAETNKTKKHALVRNFLQSIIGVAKSEWFKQKEIGNKSLSSRTIAGQYERPSTSALDTAEHHEAIGDDLATLFDDE